MFKMKIYIVSHKEIEPINLPNYQVIGVGNCPKVNGYVYDNTGDNISTKNASFCELTALYWIWKNTNDDIVGLVHYRRFFANKSLAFKFSFLNTTNINKILNCYDIILPINTRVYSTNKKNGKKIKNISIREQYYTNHYKKDLDLVYDIICKKFPEYKTSFNEVMDFKAISLFNMFVCKKELIDRYCEWLFDILFEAEKNIDISNYDAYQKRIFGFLSERLFNVWIKKNNLNIKYLPVINIDSNTFNQVLKNDIKAIVGF